VLQYLLCDPTTQAYRVDGVHMAMALCHHQALGSEAADRPELASFDVPQRIAQYGEALMAAHPPAALEYLAFATAAAAAANAPDGADGGAAHDSLRLFQHLLTERGAVRQLLGDDGNVAATGTPLARFVPDVSVSSIAVYSCALPG
jgi:hypothetical protein